MIVQLAVRNTLRNPVRSGLTGLTVLLGTALLTVAMSWVGGVFADALTAAAEPVGHVRIVVPAYAEREDLLLLAENLPDTDALSAVALQVDGVVEAYPRILAPVSLTVDETLGDTFGLAIGAPRGWYTERLELHANLVDGRFLEGDGEMLLGAVLAQRMGAELGDEVVVVGKTQDGSLSPVKGSLVGTVSTGASLVDQSVFLDLQTVRWMTDIEGATELLLYGEDRAQAGALADAVAALPETRALQVEAWSRREPWQSMLQTIGFIQGALNGIIVLVTALGVWNTVTMSVLERQTEIGVLRAMGLTRMETLLLFLLETLCIAFIGAALGLLLGGALALWLEQNGITIRPEITQNLGIPVARTIAADLTPAILVQAFTLAMGMAILGTIPPALRAATLPPVEAIRANR